MTATVRTEHPHIVRAAGAGGEKVVIAGTRISVAFIVGQLRAGDTPEDILASYPHLSPAGVYDAISYYYDHQDEPRRGRNSQWNHAGVHRQRRGLACFSNRIFAWPARA
jgi:uncharacterized protein (DUF433 family)